MLASGSDVTEVQRNWDKLLRRKRFLKKLQADIAADDHVVTKERADVLSNAPNGVSESGVHVQMNKTPANRWKMATFKSISMEDGVTVKTDNTSGIDNQAFTELQQGVNALT